VLYNLDTAINDFVTGTQTIHGLNTNIARITNRLSTNSN